MKHIKKYWIRYITILVLGFTACKGLMIEGIDPMIKNRLIMAGWAYGYALGILERWLLKAK